MRPDEMDEPFWCVWCPAGQSPTVKHPTMESAVKEAKRLALTCPGMQFFVLSAVAVAKSLEPVKVRYINDYDEVPF